MIKYRIDDETVGIDISPCRRDIRCEHCGKLHKGIVFRLMSDPSVDYSHYSQCPVTGFTLMIRLKD